ncbi:EamA family transporter [Escherichia coli]
MLYFIPLVALFLSWLFLDEQFTFLQGVGFIVTVLSVYFLNRKYQRSNILFRIAPRPPSIPCQMHVKNGSVSGVGM